MDDKEFEVLINTALAQLPEEFSKRLENVAILIRDWPTKEQARILTDRGERGLLLGLYEGIPQTRRGRYGIGGALPDKITIFKIPMLMISGTEDNVEKNVRDTVIHEIAHHFGLSDEEIKGIRKS